jgi:hypothetical protein
MAMCVQLLCVALIETMWAVGASVLAGVPEG